MASPERTQSKPMGVALLPWGDVIEDWIAPLGLSVESIARELAPSPWMFGFARALATVGVDSVIVWFSSSVDRPVRLRHASTGVRICILPASRTFRRVRRHMLAERLGNTANPARVLRVGLSFAAPYLATPLKTLRATLVTENCGTIICQEYESQRFDCCVLLGQLVNVPVFATFQGAMGHSRFDPRIRPHTMRHAAGFVIGSQDEAHRVRNRYDIDPARIAPISNPIDLDAWHAVDGTRTREILGIPTAALVIAWHGRVEIQIKGLDLLVGAWRRISAERPDLNTHLLLVGTGPDQKELAELLAPRRARVTWVNDFIGDVGLLRQYLSAADVYVFPSRREGFPMAPLEAMACGLPVIAAQNLGTRAIFANGVHAGGILTTTTSDALADSLTEVLVDPALRRDLGVGARSWVEQIASFSEVGCKLHGFLAAHGAPVDGRTS